MRYWGLSVQWWGGGQGAPAGELRANGRLGLLIRWRPLTNGQQRGPSQVRSDPEHYTAITPTPGTTTLTSYRHILTHLLDLTFVVLMFDRLFD